MNHEELARKRNDVARLFRHSSKIHRNCLRLNVGNSPDHENKKSIICWELLKAGKEFICEAELESPFKKRCDIVVLDDAEIIEIVHSESEESLARKAKEYPLPIRVVRV
jgi:hypothetical protein